MFSLEAGSRMAWAETATLPLPVLGQGHPRLHLLISSSSTVGAEAGGVAHIASLAALRLEEHVGRCMLARRVACVCVLLCATPHVCGTPSRYGVGTHGLSRASSQDLAFHVCEVGEGKVRTTPGLPQVQGLVGMCLVGVPGPSLTTIWLVP